MRTARATAIIALHEACRALRRAHDAFVALGEPDAAALAHEMDEDANELLTALVRPASRAEAVAS